MNRAEHAVGRADHRNRRLPGQLAERAARIRAAYRFKPLDALHLAAAAEHGCGLFLTNDAGLKRFPDITVEILT